MSKKYEMGRPELSGGKIFYPVFFNGQLYDFFESRIAAHEFCDRKNREIKK